MHSLKEREIKCWARGVAYRRTEEVKGVRELNIKMREGRKRGEKQEDGHTNRQVRELELVEKKQIVKTSWNNHTVRRP